MAYAIKDFEVKMQKSVDSVEREFSSVRAGRANPSVLDRIQVDYYGTPTPITQMAQVTVPEARSIVITPWDSKLVRDIEQAIQKSDLGINPQNDGKCIRLVFPQPTEERRKELKKQVQGLSEDGKVAIRNIRRDGMDAIKADKKDGLLTEDDQKKAEKDLQDLTDKYIKKIEGLTKEKEEEIMSV
ncbi:MAG: ribosome recycling factor [Clostridia bacterium]|nr:ribosome recycling factor [Clostridia bacterium]